jgi:hypothetical protein
MIGKLHGGLRRRVHIVLAAAGAAALASASPQTTLAAQKSFTCNPIDVAEFPGHRVHVRCSPGDGAILYFALGLSHQEDASRVLSLAATAFAAKKKLTIWYDPSDLSGAAIGCLTSDCRLLQGIRMF